jgi:hypothetical protein
MRSKGHIVEVNAVDTYVLHQPVHAFYIVIMPAAHPAVYDGGILNFGHVPGGDVIVAQVFLQPGVAAALAGRVDLVAQTAHREGFVSAVAQLAHGVVNFYLEAKFMRRIDIMLHGIVGDEGVIDGRVDGRSVVNVHHGSAGGFDGIQVVVLMVKARAPLKIGIDRVEGGDEQREVVVQHIALFHGARPAVIFRQDVVPLAFDGNAALAAVAPAGGQQQRFLQVEVGVEGAHVILVAQGVLQAGVHFANPGAILVLFGYVPFPVEGIGAQAAFLVEAHQVFGCGGIKGDVEFDIIFR